ncbi:MAG: Gx transporter family protein [Coriobacteriaceae bacterium]|nr:Gx transporter family protein [Coriobacteriaceae bacterium]
MALVCGYVELIVPLPVTVPGVKLGLGNAVILIALELLGAKPALWIMLAKVLTSTLLFANVQMMAFSLAGGLLSWAVMALAVRSGWFSVVAASVLGGIAHNTGQLIAVAALLSTQVALVNAPVLALAGTLCGLGVGVVARIALRAFPQEVL